jgi:hypothetical protein
MASRGYLIAFVAPCGLMDEYVTDSLILPGDSQGQSIAGLGPLLVGEVPIVRLDSGVIGKAVRHQRGFAGLATTPHRLAVARTRSESSAGICELRLLGESDSDLSAGGGSSTTHRTMPSTPGWPKRGARYSTARAPIRLGWTMPVTSIWVGVLGDAPRMERRLRSIDAARLVERCGGRRLRPIRTAGGCRGAGLGVFRRALARWSGSVTRTSEALSAAPRGSRGCPSVGRCASRRCAGEVASADASGAPHRVRRLGGEDQRCLRARPASRARAGRLAGRQGSHGWQEAGSPSSLLAVWRQGRSPVPARCRSSLQTGPSG